MTAHPSGGNRPEQRARPAPEDEAVQWTRVCDRGADIYEMLVSCAELNHRFVIRAAQDRCVSNEEGRVVTGKLFATARAQPALGGYQLELRARPGQAARTAQLQVSAVEVWLRAPPRPGQGAGYLPGRARDGGARVGSRAAARQRGAGMDAAD